MKHLVTYDREAKADIALALLEQQGIKAVKFGSEISAVAGPLAGFGGVQVMLADEADHAKAVDILNGASPAESEPVAAEPSSPAVDGTPYLVACVVVRAVALLLAIDAVVEITYIFENYTRIGEGTITMANPYRVRVMWEGIRLMFYVGAAGFLVYSTEAIARFLSFGLKR